MATTLSSIRFLIEREAKENVENEDIINWCNQVNIDVGTGINIPSATPQSITLLTTTIEYSLNADLKVINRLRLQSDIDDDIDRDLNIKYRIYNQKIILPNSTFWVAPDTLVVDYYKHMTYFAAVTESIDIADRFTPLYTFYGLKKIKGTEEYERMYQNMKNQVISYYSLGNEPVTVDRRW